MNHVDDVEPRWILLLGDYHFDLIPRRDGVRYAMHDSGDEPMNPAMCALVDELHKMQTENQTLERELRDATYRIKQLQYGGAR